MTYHFQAFLDEPDAPRPDNPIHSTNGGREHGFKGALVGGIHVYGWSTAAFLKGFGPGWLDHGWVDVSFRKPTYDGDRMTVNESRDAFTVTNGASEVCLEGMVGIGEAPFFPALKQATWQPPLGAAAQREALTLANAPVGQPLRPMAAPLTMAAHADLVATKLREANPIYQDDMARCHPAWLAGQPIYLLHHSYEYGPAIHTRSQIQHMAPAFVGVDYTVTGQCEDAYDRNGHHYIVNDASVWDADRQEVARMRHTAIFKLRTS